MFKHNILLKYNFLGLYCSFFFLYVQIMNINKFLDNINFEIMRKISASSNINQRQLAQELGFSLGKINYSINELKKKGFIKIEKFKKNNSKMRYLYILTSKGIKKKTKYTINFMKQKTKEYDQLKSEIRNSKNKILNQNLL